VTLTRDGLAAAGPKSTFPGSISHLAIGFFELVGKSARDHLKKEIPQMPRHITAKRQAFPRRAYHFSDRRVDDARLRRQSTHLRRLGDRSVYEYIRWVANGADPIEALAARLDIEEAGR
jgi:hypothetical protein